MSWTTALAIYFVAWWLMLFVVLPFGVRSQQEEGSVVPGTDPGAPVVPMLVKHGGFFLAAALHFARPAVSALERPLQVRGFHLAREGRQRLKANAFASSSAR